MVWDFFERLSDTVMPGKVQSALRSSGFTLFEILIALTIASIAFTGLFTIFFQVADVAEEVEEKGVLGQAGRSIMLRLGSDLEGLYRAKEKKQENTNSTLFSGEQPIGNPVQGQNVLEFSSCAGLSFDPDFPKREINRISYILSPGDDELGLFRLIRKETTHALVSGRERRTKSITLSRIVEQFEIEFFQDQDPVPVSSWNRDPFRSEGQVWPETVAVRFTLADKDKKMEFESLFWIGREQDEAEEGQ